MNIERFKKAVTTAAIERELPLISGASLIATVATFFSIYVAGSLSGLIGW